MAVMIYCYINNTYDPAIYHYKLYLVGNYIKIDNWFHLCGINKKLYWFQEINTYRSEWVPNTRF